MSDLRIIQRDFTSEDKEFFESTVESDIIISYKTCGISSLLHEHDRIVIYESS